MRTELTGELVTAFAAGAAIGTLGGLIGLGGAEFRLPLLIGLFGFAALEAVILNKATSLIVVTAALIFRSQTIPLAALLSQGQVIVTLLAGSLLGVWFGADLATKLSARALYRIIAMMLVAIALILLITHDAVAPGTVPLTGAAQTATGVGAGFVIGVVASFLGVAGGELLIPTLVLLFGLEIKLAGSVSLAVSLPTMIVGFARYSRDRSFVVISDYARFMIAMAAGSHCRYSARGPATAYRAGERSIADSRGDSRGFGIQGLATQVEPRGRAARSKHELAVRDISRSVREATRTATVSSADGSMRV